MRALPDAISISGKLRFGKARQGVLRHGVARQGLKTAAIFFERGGWSVESEPQKVTPQRLEPVEASDVKALTQERSRYE